VRAFCRNNLRGRYLRSEKELFVAHWQAPLDAGVAMLRSIALDDVVPVNDAYPVQTAPVIVVCVMFQMPDIPNEPSVNIIVPTAPPPDVQLAVPLYPLWEIVAVTVSVTLAPDAMNCQAPVHVPARFKGGAGAEGLPQPGSDNSASRAEAKIDRIEMYGLI
jgi:hypothetical protein